MKIPFESAESDASFDVKNVQLCAYRPASAIDSKLPSLNQQAQIRSIAVEVNSVCLSYGRGNSIKSILNSISLNVPEAAIYGLLGPSGCGKTTLLRCIVGRIKPKQGYVKVFGYQPNEPGSQIPGPSVGYMPQEVAVYEEFSIEEMLYYFGRLFNLSPDFLDQRILFLISFLDLPNKIVFGGQKRRVSLAAALVHSPPLLILDEPTVGVDPLLRQRKERITIIVTTHYIEEARQANVVGLMRQGRLLAENSPDQLMADYNLDTLEDVFLKLCMSDIAYKAAALSNFVQLPTDTKLSTIINGNAGGGGGGDNHNHYHHHHLANGIPEKIGNGNLVNGKSPSTITEKQFNHIETNGDLRNLIKFPSVFSIYITNKEASYDLAPLPTLHSNTNSTIDLVKNDDVLFFTNESKLSKLSNGTNGHLMHYNTSMKYNHNCQITCWNEYWATTCVLAWKNFTRLRRNIPLLLFQFLLPAIQVILFCLCIGSEPFDIDVAIVNEEQPPYLSKLFLSKIDPHTVRQHNFSSLEDAIDAVKRGDMWGVLHLSERFSVNLQKRVVMGEDVDNETIEASTIRIYPDLTNQQISFSMEKTFREAFQSFAQETLNLFGQNPALAETPIALGFPVYGDPHKQGYLEYMAPGVVVSICYIMATGLTSLAFIIERRDGLFERSLVAGVDTMQILFSHALVQISVMSIQILLVLIFTFLVFDIPSRGPFILVICLLVSQGATGMAFGLVVSALCKQENTAVMMILGSFYPNLILSGIIWPLEAMPQWIRSFSYLQPQTLPTETLRHILSRGWSIQDGGVWIGFVVTGSWFLIYVLVAAIAFKIKK
ncbi:ABC transporter G family member 20 [Sarcoptes scabiei]|uniref:ABC transporter G family member 20 n=1 Tax=Sarcoptes scabiei TaxID=52283 RepID=A0A834R104_SARSC|nr:ABC transporter G family member 20 [Sarcoptes scabiei]